VKRLTSLTVFTLLTLLATGCGDQSPVGPVQTDLNGIDAHRYGFNGHDRRVKVMTRNIYVGADVDAVIAALMTADLADDLDALADAIQTFVMTDFPTRARALAREFARSGPAVVGLQEVSEVKILIPPGIPGLPAEGVDIDVQFLPILQAALAARHLHYEVAVSIENIVAEPVTGIPGAVVRLVDYDVIMVDKRRVKVVDTFSKTFDNNVGDVALGVSLTRGWALLNAKIRGKPYAFVNTHLESGHQDQLLTELRYAQATEIVMTLEALGITVPTIVMGDLNDYPGTPMYQVLQDAGFVDTWLALKPRRDGYTCCHLKDLSNVVADFDMRIDYIWARGFGRPRGSIYRTGWLPWHRIQGPFYKLWPSDHAGLVATVRTGWGWHFARHREDDNGVGSE
jgi:endonuclease/exonuclease/phosphatase family metal-dependent hydrolase